MFPRIDVHPASEEERIAAYYNVHEAWGRNWPPEEFVQRRLRSVMHNRAQWFVLTVGDVVVASLGRYPLQFRFDGKMIPGSGIGAVHTVPEHRRHGYAATLLRRVNEWSKCAGHKISLLFSDIDPRYYERLGYVRWPSFNFVASASALRARGTAPVLAMPTTVAEHGDLLDYWYDQGNARYRLCLHRDREYWSYSSQKNYAGEFHRVCDHAERVVGYLRVRPLETHSLQITEIGTDHEKPQWEALLYQAAAVLAEKAGCHQVEGWLPESEVARAWFTAEPRGKTITMLAALDERIELNPEALGRASHFWFADAF